MTSALDHLDALERALAARGFPGMSPFWRATFTDFYATGKRQLVLRVGRRGGKSSSLCRIAVLEGLFGEHKIPPGDLGVVAIVSVSRDEATQRLRTIREILNAIRVKYRPVDGGIEIENRPIAFKVFASSISSVSGFTCITAICDEVAKWRDADTGANPAKEILASLRPTMATQRSAKLFLSSSPVGSQDAHATAFEEGQTVFQSVASAPTWVANPTVDEQYTHGLEPDERIWRREYAAVPQAGALGAFEADDIERAFRPRLVTHAALGPKVLVVDVSSGRKDAFTWGLAGWVSPMDQNPFINFTDVDGLHGAFWKTTNAVDVVDRLSAFVKTKEAIAVHGDQREEFLIRGAFAQNNVAFYSHPWTATSKPHAVEMVRRWFREGAIALPPNHDRLRAELHAFEERITPSGAFTFGARGSGHDDYVALIISAAMAFEAGHLWAVSPPRKPGPQPGSPEYAAVYQAHVEQEIEAMWGRASDAIERVKEEERRERKFEA